MVEKVAQSPPKGYFLKKRTTRLVICLPKERSH